MAILNRNLVGKVNRPLKILQFGVGAKLRASMDYVIQLWNESDFEGSIVLVGNTKEGTVNDLYRQDGRYTMVFNQNYETPSKIINSIEKFLDPFDNYAEFLHEAHRNDYKWVICDDEIQYEVLDNLNQPGKYYPSQLCAFLKSRYDHFNGDKEKGLKIICFEDMDNNSEHLKRFVIRIARETTKDEDFIKWINEANQFYSGRLLCEAKEANKEEIKQLNRIRGYQDKGYLLVNELPNIFIQDGNDLGLPNSELVEYVTGIDKPDNYLPRIDLHCDTLTRYTAKDNQENDLFISEGQVDLKRLIESGGFIQDFAIFLCEKFNPDMDVLYQEFKRIRNVFFNNANKYQDKFSVILDKKTLEKNLLIGKCSGLLSIEDGAMINNQIERLDEMYELGVRLIGLTWNFENCIGYPNSTDEYTMNRGLKPFGIEVIKKMNELGIIIDVSHLSDGGFWDVIEHSKKPIVASHSNCRAITNVTRNMTDEMIKALKENGGVMGLNLCPSFLGDNKDVSTIEDMVLHIEHMKKVGGIDVIALGSDFDGIWGTQEVNDCSEFGKLEAALRDKGFTQEEIEKIFYRNALRVIEANLK